MAPNKITKTIIAILSQKNDASTIDNLVQVIEYAKERRPEFLNEYGFLVSHTTLKKLGEKKSNPYVKEFLEQGNIAELPSFSKDSGMILNWLVVQKCISMTWSFMSPNNPNLFSPYTDTFLRLCDVWNVKKYITLNAIFRWLEDEYESDLDRNLQEFPPDVILRKHLNDDPKDETSGKIKYTLSDIVKTEDIRRIGKEDEHLPKIKKHMPVNHTTIALVVELPLVDKLVDLVMIYEEEFKSFERIITTNNIGQILREKVPSLKRIYEYHSASRGGFIEVSAEIILGECDALIFLTDPLQVHPYRQDTKLVFNSCILSNTIKVITNESHAKEWLEKTARKGVLCESGKLPKEICQCDD